MYFPEVSPDVAYDCIADIRLRKKWDHRLESFDVIERTEESILQYNKLMKVKIPFFSQRDQVVKQYLTKDYP